MKSFRSFSLLTFILLSGVAALSVAIYSANNEVAETKALMKVQSEEMGYLAIDDPSELQFRRLGGYPLMAFAFRYYLPAGYKYEVHIGSGAVDPETGEPPTLVSRQLTDLEKQGTLVVSLQKMPTKFGSRWSVQSTADEVFQNFVCSDENEFTWLQTHLAAFPSSMKSAARFEEYFTASAKVSGHQESQSFSPLGKVVLCEQKEFHASAVSSLTQELLDGRRVFRIWIEAMKVEGVLEEQ
jgi:hypothetical protein